MIFNKEFDKTLKLILDGDKNNKEIIIDFIRLIPDSLYGGIKSSLMNFDKIKKENTYLLDMEDIEGEFIVNNKIKYYFILDTIFNCLTIGKNYLIDGYESKEFELKLYSDGSDTLSFGEQYLGSLYKSYANDKVDYELVNSVFGLMFVSKNRHLVSSYKKVHRVENKHKLVRVRKYKN